MENLSKRAIEVIKEVLKIMDHNDVPGIKIDDIINFVEYINKNTVETVDKISKEIENEESVILYGVIVIAIMQLLFEEKRGDKNALICKIVNSYCSQIINYAISILRLAKYGFDNPARSLFRVSMELVWQLIILASDDRSVKIWIDGSSDDEANKAWIHLFKGKMNNKLSKIESKLNLPPEISEYMRTQRAESIKFYSQAVHHSSSATVLGNFRYLFDDDHVAKGVAFGAATASIKAPLQELIQLLLYFFLLFPRVFELRPNPPFCKEGNLWEAYSSAVVLWFAIEKKLSEHNVCNEQ